MQNLTLNTSSVMINTRIKLDNENNTFIEDAKQTLQDEKAKINIEDNINAKKQRARFLTNKVKLLLLEYCINKKASTFYHILKDDANLNHYVTINLNIDDDYLAHDDETLRKDETFCNTVLKEITDVELKVSISSNHGSAIFMKIQ